MKKEHCIFTKTYDLHDDLTKLVFSHTIVLRESVHHGFGRIRQEFSSGKGNAKSNSGPDDQSISNVGQSAERLWKQAKIAYFGQ